MKLSTIAFAEPPQTRTKGTTATTSPRRSDAVRKQTISVRLNPRSKSLIFSTRISREGSILIGIFSIKVWSSSQETQIEIVAESTRAGLGKPQLRRLVDWVKSCTNQTLGDDDSKATHKKTLAQLRLDFVAECNTVQKRIHGKFHDRRQFHHGGDSVKASIELVYFHGSCHPFSLGLLDFVSVSSPVPLFPLGE